MVDCLTCPHKNILYSLRTCACKTQWNGGRQRHQIMCGHEKNMDALCTWRQCVCVSLCVCGCYLCVWFLSACVYVSLGIWYVYVSVSVCACVMPDFVVYWCRYVCLYVCVCVCLRLFPDVFMCLYLSLSISAFLCLFLICFLQIHSVFHLCRIHHIISFLFSQHLLFMYYF